MEIETCAIEMIRQAIQVNCSDIHILPYQSDYRVYFRNAGTLYLKHEASLDWGKKIINHFKFIAHMDIGERRKPQSGSTHIQLDQQNIELRFSTITNVNLLESIVIRLIKQSYTHHKVLPSYFPKDLLVLRNLVRRKSGLILFSGPVGSGKTSTIYQLLRARNEEEQLQIMTMEDPVEIIEPAFLQTEVNQKAGISYELLIKASLRHHPDILVIGEIRDEETARMVIRGALTGHLMIATIHAKNSLGVIARLTELNVSSEQIKQTLIGIISQRLIPTQCQPVQAPDLDSLPSRLALFEVLYGEALQTYLSTGLAPPSFKPFNHQLRKVWALGFITDTYYHHFELV